MTETPNHIFIIKMFFNFHYQQSLRLPLLEHEKHVVRLPLRSPWHVLLLSPRLRQPWLVAIETATVHPYCLH